MPPLVTLGRVLFVLLFIVSGASKIFDIPGTTTEIATKIVPSIPAMAAQYVTQIETLTTMPIAQLLAILAGVLEVVCGLMIAINIGARFFAVLLILFTIMATYYFHDFWAMTGGEKINNMIHALKNLSIIGGLLMIVGYPSAFLSDSNYTGAAEHRY